MTKPKLFKASLKDQQRIASIIAKSISKNKGILLSDGQIIKGQKK